MNEGSRHVAGLFVIRSSGTFMQNLPILLAGHYP